MTGVKWLRRAGAVLLLTAGLVLSLTVMTPPAHAAILAPRVTTHTLGDRILGWAEVHATGHWYGYGGTGPAVYDCSGLVFAAARAEGITLPRTTYGMPGSWHLVRTYSPRRGDLAFFGTGHVEILTAWYHTTFGAHHTGLRIGWRKYGPGYMPTAFYRVR